MITRYPTTIVLLIALDGLGASINLKEAMYWLPVVIAYDSAEPDNKKAA